MLLLRNIRGQGTECKEQADSLIRPVFQGVLLSGVLETHSCDMYTLRWVFEVPDFAVSGEVH